jgi:hypothetical protein
MFTMNFENNFYKEPRPHLPTKATDLTPSSVGLNLHRLIIPPQITKILYPSIEKFSIEFTIYPATPFLQKPAPLTSPIYSVMTDLANPYSTKLNTPLATLPMTYPSIKPLVSNNLKM